MIATGPVQQNAGAGAGAQPQNSSIMQAYLRAQAQSRGGNAQMTGATQVIRIVYILSFVDLFTPRIHRQ